MANEFKIVKLLGGLNIQIDSSGVLNNVSATAPPTASDDTGSGYSVNSHWIDITNDEVYVCVDDTATAAVWKNLSLDQAEVSANVDVAANTTNRHNHTNKALLDTYTQTEVDLASAVLLKHTHTNKALLDAYTFTNAAITSLISSEHTHANKVLLDTYTQLEVDIADAVTKKHAHTNFALLETYTQTELDIADAISKEHVHANILLLDTYAQTEINLADAVAKKHAHGNFALLETYTQTEIDIADAIAKEHTHANKALLDTYTQTEIDIADAIAKEHVHANITALDLVSGTNTGDQDLSIFPTKPVTVDNTALRANGIAGEYESSQVVIDDDGRISQTGLTGGATILGVGAGLLITGAGNTVVGNGSSPTNATGTQNTHFGSIAGAKQTAGHSNSFFGASTCSSGLGNMTGSANTGIGYHALQDLYSTSAQNLAVGAESGKNLSVGSRNIFLGYNAGNTSTSGDDNIILGASAITPTATTSDYLNIGDAITGDLVTKNVSVVGTLDASNLSGTNTGDQDISVFPTKPVTVDQTILRANGVTGEYEDSIPTIDDVGKYSPNVEGDQFCLSQDLSILREGSWSVTASGALYTLLGQFCMKYMTHNVEVDASGNFLTRDEAGDHCQLIAWLEDGTEVRYHTSNTTGVPIWVYGYSIDASIGKVSTGLGSMHLHTDIADGAGVIGVKLHSENDLLDSTAWLFQVASGVAPGVPYMGMQASGLTGGGYKFITRDKHNAANDSNRIYAQFLNNAGTPKFEIGTTVSTPYNTEIRFKDDTNTRIGFPNSDPTYFAFINDATEIWLGRNTDKTVYINYYVGDNIYFGRAANLQDIIAYSSTFAIDGTTNVASLIITPNTVIAKPYHFNFGTNTAGFFVKDNKFIGFGNAPASDADAKLYYDGTDFIVNPKAVGTGMMDVQGQVRAENAVLLGGTTTRAALHFDTATALKTTPVAGDMEYKDGHWYITNGARHVISTSAGVKTSTTTVVNTVTETQIYAYTFAADELHLDEQVLFEMNGVFSNASASDDFTVRFKVGGVTVHTINRAGGNVTNQGWEAQYKGTVRSVGASGTFVDFAKWQVTNVSGIWCKLLCV